MPKKVRDSADTATFSRIAGLALPALAVLSAEPLYVLVDIAIVGRLGALSLAGLAVGGLLLAQISTQLTFLSYGTTSRAARLYGAGDRKSAIGEGIQATLLAAVVGIVLVILAQFFAHPVLLLLSGNPDIAVQAETWFRIAVCGVPLILLCMAGNGWMRGVQDTARPLQFIVLGLVFSGILAFVLVPGVWGAPRLGLAGSAIANIAGQAISAMFFIIALRREGDSTMWRPNFPIMCEQIVLGRDLILRSFAFQLCFLSAAAVASRFGVAVIAAHQLILQLWNLVALVLDSLAIAAQALVGAALGASKVRVAGKLAWQITKWSVVLALILSLAFALGHEVIPRMFTSDSVVLESMAGVWWFFVLLIPLAGVVFALDGVLLGAGDAAYLRTTTLLSALVGFLPLIWISLVYGWGLQGIWLGLTAFIVLRMVAVIARAKYGNWAVPGRDIEQ
ncbi:MAG: MATE family efflux transporter [Mycobacteriaceae bacterium]